MFPQTSENAKQVIQKIIDLIKQKMPAKTAKMLENFVWQYYANVAEEELFARDVIDLYGAVVSHWNFLHKRKPGQVNLRVYNPSFKKHGWQSSHTIVELAQDDMPFLVDSLTLELTRLGLNIHHIVHSGGLRLVRDKTGLVTSVLMPNDKPSVNEYPEAPIHIEIDRQLDDAKVLGEIHDALQRVLDDVSRAVSDYIPMKQHLRTALEELAAHSGKTAKEDLDEYLKFLEWLDNDHFTFLGYAEFKVTGASKARFEASPANNLGLLKDKSRYERMLTEVRAAHEAMTGTVGLLIAKSNDRATVHRASYMDVIRVKRFDSKGKIIGEACFLGLFTSVVYHNNPRLIPLLRRKVNQVIARAGFSPKGHANKTLINILETLPRDELFQMEEDELFRTSISILQIQKRQKIRVFARRDVFGHYFSCMIFVPADLFNTDLCLKVQNILMQELKGESVSYKPNFLEEWVLYRIDYIIRISPKTSLPNLDVKQLESQIIIAARDWRDDLKVSLVDSFGEHKGHVLYAKYARAFPAGYRETFLARSAVADIEHIEVVLANTDGLEMRFYRMLEEPEDFIRFKLFRKDKALPLTNILPILENLGLNVIEERPYQVRLSNDSTVWISDFGMQVNNSLVQLDEISSVFQDAFARIWRNEVENDSFNRLVMRAGMNWRDILVLRAYAKYLMQIGFRFSQQYVEDTLTENPGIAKKLVEFFKVKFDPALQKDSDNRLAAVEAQIKTLLEKVSNLDKDRILRSYVTVIKSTLRTNYFQLKPGNEPKAYVSLKFNPSLIPDMPQPIPKFEIFVYSPKVEGVHLRGAKVARGGLRWSDRREDFRTEVLGLMKAQQVKNAVIVPLGAKGGFVPKQLPLALGREAVQEEAVNCYKTFIRGLLDITDNLKNGKVIPPKQVVRYDEDDPYLVVAADKGTATFSDYANGVSAEYGFWMDDAFASGGSNGYDHKKMGITARGAWESVKRHFIEIGKDIHHEDFTVVGIGDMAGDVFGNGMLRSRHIKLVAAFNHMHIFLDPNPDAAVSYKERERLFNLPRSSWLDYDKDLISTGGGIFERSAKTIPLSPQVRSLLGVEVDSLEPNLLIQAILKANVDLLWNGGIGTYVKAAEESHFNVGDRANNALRVNANDLRCKIVGEGGNLGFTQLARIQFALGGGKIYTDAIDNSAGVDCSDHEVNIKILLNEAMVRGDLTIAQRNKLLAQMQDEVGLLVLQDNYQQTQAISIMQKQAQRSVDSYIRLMRELEREKHLDRDIEFLPGDKALKARFAAGQGLTAPELSVLMAYTKTVIKRAIVNSPLPEDPYFSVFLEAEFPAVLRQKFGKLMREHHLAKEIIATQLTNTMVRYMDITYVLRMYDETGATPAMTARAFTVICQALDIPAWWSAIEELDGKVSWQLQSDMMQETVRLARRGSRWLLRNHRGNLNVSEMITKLTPKLNKLVSLLPRLLSDNELEARQQVIQRYMDGGVPKILASRISDTPFMLPMLDIIAGSEKSELPLNAVSEVYYRLNDRLSFGWFKESLLRFNSEGYWQMLSAAGLRDDLEKLQRMLSISILRMDTKTKAVNERVEEWAECYRYMVERWNNVVVEIRAGKQEFVNYYIALRGLLDLAQASTYGADSYQHREVPF